MSTTVRMLQPPETRSDTSGCDACGELPATCSRLRLRMKPSQPMGCCGRHDAPTRSLTDRGDGLSCRRSTWDTNRLDVFPRLSGPSLERIVANLVSRPRDNSPTFDW